MGYKLLTLKDVEIGDIVFPYLPGFHGPYKVYDFKPIAKEQYGDIHEFELVIRRGDLNEKPEKVNSGHVVLIKPGPTPQKREVYIGVKLHELIEEMLK